MNLKLNPAQKHDILYVLSVHNSNPNGDPDADNSPRTNPFTGHGIISDVSVKRKIRDYVSTKGHSLLIEHGDVIDSKAYTAMKKAGIEGISSSLSSDLLAELLDLGVDLPAAFEVSEQGLTYDDSAKAAELKRFFGELKDTGASEDLIAEITALTGKKRSGTDRRATQQQAVPAVVSEYWDARVFGFTAPGSAGKTRGPVQMSMAESTAPINVIEQVVTRVARAKADEKEGNGQFGRRHIVDHAVYVGEIFINPFLAEQQGVSEEDLGLLIEGLQYGYDLSRSSARPDVRVETIIILTHDSQYGSAPFHQLKKRLSIQHDGGQHVQVSFNQEGLPQGVTVQII